MERESGLTRRQFVSAAAGAAAITIVPKHVLGKTAPSNLINIGVVGSGGHGAFVVNQMLKAGGVNLVALCDVDSWSANHIETKEYGSRRITGLYKRFPKLPKYKDFRVMLDKEQKNIDAVVITTPELDKPRILKETPSKKTDNRADIQTRRSPRSELEKLLIRIDQNDLPKAYNIRKHQEYVDRRLARLSDAKKARIAKLWADKRRVHPQMTNRGKSFVRIMEYVAGGEK